tara:strand:+ start:106 stop:303 length:198 start_codon:yes stop_codon:yes gene_type:complete
MRHQLWDPFMRQTEEACNGSVAGSQDGESNIELLALAAFIQGFSESFADTSPEAPEEEAREQMPF